MVDADDESESTLATNMGHEAVRRSKDAGANVIGDIQARVKSFGAGEGVEAITELRADVPRCGHHTRSAREPDDVLLDAFLDVGQIGFFSLSDVNEFGRRFLDGLD